MKPAKLEVERRNKLVRGVFEPVLEVAGLERDVLLEQLPAEYGQGTGWQQGHEQERHHEVTRPTQPLSR